MAERFFEPAQVDPEPSSSRDLGDGDLLKNFITLMDLVADRATLKMYQSFLPSYVVSQGEELILRELVDRRERTQYLLPIVNLLGTNPHRKPMNSQQEWGEPDVIERCWDRFKIILQDKLFDLVS